jgi:hypothetical protein
VVLGDQLLDHLLALLELVRLEPLAALVEVHIGVPLDQHFVLLVDEAEQSAHVRAVGQHQP